MPDIKKEQECEELHRAIWSIANELRGSVDGWDFKNYVLGTMFYRYISENLTEYVNKGEREAGDESFDYAQMGQGPQSNINAQMINDYPIPVPTLEEQDRIVMLLDRFDTLCNDISNGLPAEIAARQKQYEYYRDKLLTFKAKETA